MEKKFLVCFNTNQIAEISSETGICQFCFDEIFASSMHGYYHRKGDAQEVIKRRIKKKS